MKATDLMIGDWVQFTYPHHETGSPVVRVFQVKQIEAQLGDYYVWSEDGRVGPPEQLQPIPLTPEILEKNGWKKRNNYQWTHRDNFCKIVVSIAPQIEIDGEPLGTPPVHIMLEGALFNVAITFDGYVHELQHALRLCGIEKEIKL